MDSKLATQIGLAFGLFVFGGIFFKMVGEGRAVMGLIGGGLIGVVAGLMGIGLLSPLIKKDVVKTQIESEENNDIVVTEKAIAYADDGDVKAQVLVGTGYLSGQYGLPQDENMAAKYFLAAALQNNAYAAFVVAGLYFDGVGIEKSVESARVWAQKSKDLGYPDAEVMVRAIDDAARA